MEVLEERLGYKFRNRELLREALTHTVELENGDTSVLNNAKRICDRLKIIGDCVIKLVCCQYSISVSPPDAKLGSISKIKDELCTRQRQNEVGRLLELKRWIVVRPDLQSTAGFSIESNYDTFVKSVLGAIFIDAGGSQRKGFVSTWRVFLKLWKSAFEKHEPIKPLLACFPEPRVSSREFLREKFDKVKFRDLNELEEKIGFVFTKKPYLLEQAFTHDSITEFGKTEFVHYQCLEFLGDGVLELVIMEYLYSKYSSSDPLGQMLFFNRETGQKLYSAKFQVKVAKKLQLELYVLKPPHIVLQNFDDFVESLIGAVYVHSGIAGLKKTAKIVLDLWDLQPLESSPPPDEVQQSNCVRYVAVPVPVTSVPVTSVPAIPSPSPPKNPLLVQFQAKLGYTFKDLTILKALLLAQEAEKPTSLSTEDSSTLNPKTSPQYLSNVQVLGKSALGLHLAEYVIGICPVTNINLSASVKKSMENLRQLLAGGDIVREIASKLEMKKYAHSSSIVNDDKVRSFTTSSEDAYVFGILGAVYLDSEGKYRVFSNLVKKLWSSYVKTEAKPITACFPLTEEGQEKFRAAVNGKITESMWTSLQKKLGYKFKNKNLLEQALTDEKSQGFAKAVHNATHTANPFALQILGRTVVELFAAKRGLKNTESVPENFPSVMARLDHSFFNTLRSNFSDLGRYYAKHFKNPFPPTRKPRGPFEAMLGAVYVDAGGADAGFDIMEKLILKQNPTLANIVKAKALPVEAGAATPPVAGVTEKMIEEPGASVSTPNPPPATAEVVKGERQTPVKQPSSPASLNDSLNLSFSSKCAANFNFSPDPKKSCSSSPRSDASFVREKEKPVVEEQPKPSTSYAHAVINGKTEKLASKKDSSSFLTENSLIVAVREAQSKIEVLKKKPGAPQPPQVKQANGVGNAAKANGVGNAVKANGVGNAGKANGVGNAVKANGVGNAVKANGVGNAAIPKMTKKKKKNKKHKSASASDNFETSSNASFASISSASGGSPVRKVAPIPQQVPQRSTTVFMTPAVIAKAGLKQKQNSVQEKAKERKLQDLKANALGTPSAPDARRSEELQRSRQGARWVEEDTGKGYSLPTRGPVPTNKVHGYPNENFVQPGTSKQPHKDDEDSRKKFVTPSTSDGPEDAGGSRVLTIMKWTALALGVFYLVNKFRK